jgi:hypothetical protein
MKRSDQQTDEDFREQRRRQMERPLELRLKYGFYRVYRPVLDDAAWRSFRTMEDYRQWCEKELQEYLDYRRAK